MEINYELILIYNKPLFEFIYISIFRPIFMQEFEKYIIC